VNDLTPLEAAAELGCSRTLIYRLIERGELPGTYELPGSRRKRIPRGDIEALKKRQRVSAERDVPLYEPRLARPAARRSTTFAQELAAIEAGAAP
jgi:excisionase family DNA binding protein